MNNSRKYRKKPVVIRAIQWVGTNASSIKRFAGDDIEFINGDLFIYTLEGRMMASIGDYIIRGVDNEYYACKPDIFERTYELVKD